MTEADLKDILEKNKAEYISAMKNCNTPLDEQQKALLSDFISTTTRYIFADVYNKIGSEFSR